MTKSKSWTRFAYERAYRQMRRGCDFDSIADGTGIELEILVAADYSCQAKDHFVNGWTNNMRFSKFVDAMLLNKYSVWGIPF